MARPKKRTTVRIENLTAKVEELEAQAREDLRKREPFLKEMEECAEAQEFHLHLAELKLLPETLHSLSEVYKDTLLEIVDKFENAGMIEHDDIADLQYTIKQYFSDVRELIKIYETLKNKQ